MSYRVIIKDKYKEYKTKQELTKDLIGIIQSRKVYPGMPRKERNMITYSRTDDVNYLIFNSHYTVKDIVKAAGGELR